MKKRAGILVLVVMLVGLGVLLGSMGRKRDIRREAAVNEVDVLILPLEKEVLVGENFLAVVMVDTMGVKLVAMEAVVSYDEEKLRVKSVMAGSDETVANFFGAEGLVDIRVDEVKGKIYLSAVSLEETELPAGVINMFKINFEAKAVGEVEVFLDEAGDNNFIYQEGRDLGELSLKQSIHRSSYSVLEPEGDEAVLNFWVTFSGLKSGSRQCGRDWDVDLIVLGGGQTGVYRDVEIVEDGVKVLELPGGEVKLARYRGGLRLEGFSVKNNVAAYMKGPMHLQVKYAVSNQDSFYGGAGGQLLLTSDFRTSPVYDFSAYPMLAGDVTGEVVGVADGIMDGRDFSYIKSKVSVSKEPVASGGTVRGDLDGDCWIGNVDLAIFIMSVKESRRQLY